MLVFIDNRTGTLHMKLSKTLAFLGGFVLYANALLLSAVSVHKYIVLWEINWKIALAITIITPAMTFLFVLPPVVAWFMPGIIKEQTEKSETKLTAYMWLVLGTLFTIIIPIALDWLMSYLLGLLVR